MNKTLNRLIKAGILFFFAICFLVFSAFWYFSLGLPDYKKFTVAMLKDACRDKGLSVYRNLRKHDLVELLETSQAN